MKVHFLSLVFSFLSLISPSVQSAGFGGTLFKEGQAISGGFCGSDNWYQFPGQPDLFLGRMRKGITASNPCGVDQWSLILARLDRSTQQMTYIRSILETPAAIQGGKYTIQNAYDPTVIFFKNQYWMAFECSGGSVPGTASSCMVPLSPDGSLDPSQVYVAILGVTMQPELGYNYSGSVPKLMTSQGRAYLYWSAVAISTQNGQWCPQNTIQTRGVELVLDTSGRLVPAGFGPEMPSDHPLSTIVFGTDPKDPRASSVADSFDVIEYGGFYYMTTAMGGSPCTVPDANIEGCYRMSIRRSYSPLAPYGFNQEAVNESELPSNIHEYAHFVRHPSTGKLEIAVQLFPSTKSQNANNPGYFIFPLADQFESYFSRTGIAGPNASLNTIVQEAYQMVLGRPADPSGLQFFVGKLTQGLSKADLLRTLFMSDELQLKYPLSFATSGSFVTFAYKVFLGRDADPEGYQSFVRLLDSGQRGRADVLWDFIKSPEFQTKHPLFTE